MLSEPLERGLVTEVFEGRRRILMLEGVRMLSREPPTFRRGLPEEFIRGVWEFWGFEYPRDRPPGVDGFILKFWC